MRAYLFTEIQAAAQRYTHAFKLTVADFSVGFSNKQIVLLALAKGDAVLRALVHVTTPVVGPTVAPTAQVKVGAVAITPTAAVKTADAIVLTDNTVVGATGLTAAANLVLDLQVGGGDGAVATAGEIIVQVEISRRAVRNYDS
jgi:hypothetical protein